MGQAAEQVTVLPDTWKCQASVFLQTRFLFKSTDIAAALLLALAESPCKPDRHPALALALDSILASSFK